MRIRNASGMAGGQPPENVFIALDRMGNQMGTCQVAPCVNEELMPERPFEVKLSIQARGDAVMNLIGAAMSRAMLLAHELPDMKARIYTECAPGNARLLEMLSAAGFRNDDGLIRMRRRVLPGPNVSKLPDGLILLSDALEDEIERCYFVKRLERLYKLDDAESRMESFRSRPCFRRFLAVAREGLASELVCWAEEGQGVVGMIATSPVWRRRGVGLYLMDTARQYFYQCRLPEAYVDVRMRMLGATRLAASGGYRQSEVLMRYPGIDL